MALEGLAPRQPARPGARPEAAKPTTRNLGPDPKGAAQWSAYLAQRFLSLLFTLLLATIAIFAMMHSVPGGPFTFTQGVLSPAAMHNIMVQLRPGRAHLEAVP